MYTCKNNSLVPPEMSCDLSAVDRFPNTSSVRGNRQGAPRREHLQKKRSHPGLSQGRLLCHLNYPLRRGLHSDDIPPYVRMSGQLCTNRDFKGYGVPKWEDSAPGKRALAVSQLLNLEACKGGTFHMEACAKTTAPLFIQKDVEEGVVNPNLAVIFDEPQFPKAIHKKTHA